MHTHAHTHVWIHICLRAAYASESDSRWVIPAVKQSQLFSLTLAHLVWPKSPISRDADAFFSSSFIETPLNGCLAERMATVEMILTLTLGPLDACCWPQADLPVSHKRKVWNFLFHYWHKCLPGRFMVNRLLSGYFSSFCGLPSCSRTGVRILMEIPHFII